jgi:hypothetical protein
MATITLSYFLIILQVSTILKCSYIFLSQQASLSAAAIMMELSLLSNKFREPIIGGSMTGLKIFSEASSIGLPFFFLVQT